MPNIVSKLQRLLYVTKNGAHQHHNVCPLPVDSIKYTQITDTCLELALLTFAQVRYDNHVAKIMLKISDRRYLLFEVNGRTSSYMMIFCK